MSSSPHTRNGEAGPHRDPEMPQELHGRAVVPYHAHCPTCGSRYLIRYWARSSGSQGPWEELVDEGDPAELLKPCRSDACKGVVDLSDPEIWHPARQPSP